MSVARRGSRATSRRPSRSATNSVRSSRGSSSSARPSSSARHSRRGPTWRRGPSRDGSAEQTERPEGERGERTGRRSRRGGRRRRREPGETYGGGAEAGERSRLKAAAHRRRHPLPNRRLPSRLRAKVRRERDMPPPQPGSFDFERVPERARARQAPAGRIADRAAAARGAGVDARRRRVMRLARSRATSRDAGRRRQRRLAAGRASNSSRRPFEASSTRSSTCSNPTGPP